MSSRGDSRECEHEDDSNLEEQKVFLQNHARARLRVKLLEDSLSRLRLVDDCGEESEHGNSSREEFVFAPERSGSHA